MPRKGNAVSTVSIRLSTTEAVKTYLEALVARGLYGKTIPEVAERLISEHIRHLIATRELDR